ncbi:hypothetical protein GDO86_009240 [Hymenochirus boettgeri]|uniref:non-specific serine/threonine protein kinase n=1 Tax=Hymenochirus boettgeri TaxID=247094 RepID=A0A8T2JI63_9PIPI|nr:hypothetical protein GDO86_009240 [Hymenochirus boettgeri]
MPPKKTKLPVPLPEGWVLTDTNKKSWALGKMIGKGGFGLIYLASPYCDRPVPDDAAHVIKLEYHHNGPLFCELKFYQRAAKPEEINRWTYNQKLDYLGIPKYWGSGNTTFNSTSYRFMVIDRLGVDLQTVLNNNRGRLPIQKVMQLGTHMLDVLEFIHENEYVHCDIKAANILFGYTDKTKVYLADYGLSYRYCPNGSHKEYKENPRKGHNGTIEFTSLDAHKGVAPSRRGDLEILAYCMIHWLCGNLPWEHDLKNPVAVQMSKTKLLDTLRHSVVEWTAGQDGSYEIASFLDKVHHLEYDQKPNYEVLKKVLKSDGRKSTAILNSKPVVTTVKRCTATSTKTNQREEEAFQQVYLKEKNIQHMRKPDLRKPGRNLNKLKTENMQCLRKDWEHLPNTKDNWKNIWVDNSDYYNLQDSTDMKRQIYIYSPENEKNPKIIQNPAISNIDFTSAHRSEINQDHGNIWKYSLVITVVLLMLSITLYTLSDVVNFLI